MLKSFPSETGQEAKGAAESFGIVLERSAPAAVLGCENQRGEKGKLLLPPLWMAPQALHGQIPRVLGSILRHPPPLGSGLAATAFIPALLLVGFSSLSHVAGLDFSFLPPSHGGNVLVGPVSLCWDEAAPISQIGHDASSQALAEVMLKALDKCFYSLLRFPEPLLEGR